jgi:hypothetical protein
MSGRFSLNYLIKLKQYTAGNLWMDKCFFSIFL